jgi:hypothetical protein
MQRGKMSVQERKLRSRLAQLAGARTLIHATLSVRHVTCGKKGCRCTQGERHRAVYLVSSAKGKKRQVFVPSAMEQEVRAWVGNYHMATDLLEQVSEGAWNELTRRKEQDDS